MLAQATLVGHRHRFLGLLRGSGLMTNRLRALEDAMVLLSLGGLLDQRGSGSSWVGERL